MHRATCKPQILSFKNFAAQITELNHYPPLFYGLIKSKEMDSEELNKILLSILCNDWAKQYYLQGWDFEGKTYKETCDMF